MAPADAGRVEHDEHDRLDRDPAEDVADGDADLAGYAALTVIAISGRFVATASRTPPRAEPKCSRLESTSVVSESWTPATQIAAAHARKINSCTREGREDTLAASRGIGPDAC